MLNIKGKTGDDYFVIYCEKCGENTVNEYLGYDPGVPRFKATCQKCGDSGIWKLGTFEGLPQKVA